LAVKVIENNFCREENKMSGQSRNISEEFKWSGNQNSNRFQLAPGTVVEFAGRKEGRRIITTRDDYFRRLSTFDKSARMLAVSGISETGYRKFLAKCVIDWNEEEKQKIIPILEVFSKEVASHYLPFPCKVPLVRTSGEEEIHAAYTRANAIFLPHYFVNDAEPQILAEVIRHEFFHVLTRANPNLRDKLYKIIGFERSGEVKFPQPLRGRIITNPDAPVNDHCIKVGYKEIKSEPCQFFLQMMILIRLRKKVCLIISASACCWWNRQIARPAWCQFTGTVLQF